MDRRLPPRFELTGTNTFFASKRLHIFLTPLTEYPVRWAIVDRLGKMLAPLSFPNHANSFSTAFSEGGNSAGFTALIRLEDKELCL